MVTIDRNKATRRPVRRADLSPEEQEVADAFVAGRLLTGDCGACARHKLAWFGAARP
ncbi:hypothetical protein ACIGW8_26755 [Streptomyces sioyaensis]|uniref:hypothetical protein n=1 Tax=Streptomyces sioyaensis TaxID=67364 RepID=UPI0037CF0E05